MLQTSEIDWEIILDTIRSEKCVLFLGPEVFLDMAGRSLKEKMIAHLDLENNPDIQTYYPDDHLFLFKSRGKQTKAYYKIKNFFQQPFPEAEAIFAKLARIPIHLIISIVPDKKLTQAFEKLSIKHKFDFYFKNQPPSSNTLPATKDTPLIYNIFGSIDRQESLILTHNDVFDYLESSFKGNSMADTLKHKISEADNFIFLGIQFEKWYMQILLRLLHMHDDTGFMRFGASQSTGDAIKTLMYDQFNIEFVPHRVKEFIEQLYEQCKAAGMLREVDKPQVSVIDQLMDWMAEDKLERVFEGLKDFLGKFGEAGEELLEDMIMISNRNKRLNRKVNQGIKSSEEANLEGNKIRKSLIDLLSEAKMLE